MTLARGEIHVWRAPLDQSVDDLDQRNAMLSEQENVRAARYRFERDRRRFLLRHSLLRVILSRYLDTEPARLRFNYGPSGKPALANPRDDALQFNLSHSDGMALYAVTREGAIGVDIERVRAIPEAGEIAARYFSQEETAEWLSQPSDQQPKSFLRHWSRKEAWLKMSGRGIFDVAERIPSAPESKALDEAAIWPRFFVPHTECILHELTPAAGYVGALALAVPEMYCSADRNAERLRMNLPLRSRREGRENPSMKDRPHELR